MRKSFPHPRCVGFRSIFFRRRTHEHTSIPFTAEQADHAALVRILNQLVRDELARSLSVEAMTTMLDGGIAGLASLASLANAASVSEGRLLEKVITLIAEANPDLTVFAQVRLPVHEDALELVDKNPEALYRGLTLDANARTRKVSVADLIIVDRRTRVAHVVDIKRSLGSYETARIVELRQRMLAAALVAPDLLWRDHQRIAVGRGPCCDPRSRRQAHRPQARHLELCPSRPSAWGYGCCRSRAAGTAGLRSPDRAKPLGSAGAVVPKAYGHAAGIMRTDQSPSGQVARFGVYGRPP
jgi:hypothetical protein